MAYGATHILAAIIILDIFRHYVFGKKNFPRYLLAVGGIAGLMPDIDIIISWIYNFITSSGSNFHGVFTHSIIFPLIFLALAIEFQLQNNPKWAKIFYVISAGWMIHIGVDWLFGEVKEFLWPLAINPSWVPDWDIWEYSMHIDAILLTLWILHEELHNKIKDYF